MLVFMPTELVGKRNELLEARLVEIRRGRIEAEREAAEETRRELALEIERERAAAQERSDQQKKELDLRIEPRVLPTSTGETENTVGKVNIPAVNEPSPLQALGA